MVRINGARVKEIREQQGLTQLYVATVVEVTTDTISRWENRRYPSIKRENAEKLAQALTVELADFLDGAEEDLPPSENVAPVDILEPPPLELSAPVRHHPRWPLLFTGAVVLLLAVFLFFDHSPRAPIVQGFAAERFLPAQVAPGQLFPVLLQVTSDPGSDISIIISETLPPDCIFNISVPAAGVYNRKDGIIKWVARQQGGLSTFAYLVQSPAEAVLGDQLVFSGRILPGKATPVTVVGGTRMTIGSVHWADGNGDMRIDDEEILKVYDLFSELPDFDYHRDLVDDLWAAEGYRRDEQSGAFIPQDRPGVKGQMP